MKIPKDSEQTLALMQRFKNLEQQWQSYRESSKQPRNPRRFSTGSNRIFTSFDQLLEISPRELMSSLQLRRSPSDGVLNVENKNMDMAVEEILRERRVAITSGKLKGKRLFEEPSSEEELLDFDGNSEICNDWSSNVIPGSEVSINCNSDDFHQSCSVSDFPSLEEKVAVVDEKTTTTVEKIGGGRTLRAQGGGGCTVGMALFALIIFLFTIGIVAMSCNGSLHENEVMILVPT